MDSVNELLMYLEEIRGVLTKTHSTKFDLTNEIIIMTDLMEHAKEVDNILKEETKGSNKKITAVMVCGVCGGHKINPDSGHRCHACNGSGSIQKTLEVQKFWVED